MASTQKKDETVEAPEAAKQAVKDTEPAADDEPTYTVEWLMEAAQYVGYKPEEIAGALSASSKTNYTIDETRAAVKAWLEAPVSVEEA